MKPLSLVILMLVTLLSLSHSNAGEPLHLEASAGLTFMETSQKLFSNWTTAWTVGGRVAYPLSPVFEIGASLFYHQFPYRGDNSTLELAFPAIAGLRWRVDGMPTNVYEAALEARFTSSTSVFRPFMTIRGGVYFINLGQILVTTWFEGTSQNLSSAPYRGTGESFARGFGAFGGGFKLALDSNFQFGLEGRFTATFDGSYEFMPVVGTLQLLL
jgi:hypothetical protein